MDSLCDSHSCGSGHNVTVTLHKFTGD